MLKQLEVLKEEEKEFQNLKVRWILGPASVPRPTKGWGQSPPDHSWQRGCTPGCWEPLPVPSPRQNQLVPHPASLLPGCLSSGHVPVVVACPRGLSLYRDRGSGLRALSSGRSSFLGGDTKVWCQDSGVQGALVSQPGGGWTEWNALVAQEDIAGQLGG